MRRMITILGPTASGKTPVAARLAAEIGGEIISADSRQVYRRMDIGTGKDLADYNVDGHQIPYHLIDICEPGTKYNLFEYQQDFFDVYEAIQSRGVVPILCGGTGLYIEAVLKGYKLSPVPQNQELRDSLEGKSLDELTQMLTELKAKNGSICIIQPMSILVSGLLEPSRLKPIICNIPCQNGNCRLWILSSSASISIGN